MCLVVCVYGTLLPGSAAGQEFRLELVHRGQNTILASYPMQPDQEFVLHYIHSSDHTPVAARFKATAQGGIVLVEERFAWYGAGLAFHAQSDIDTSREWTAVRMHRDMDPFFLRVGRVADHALHIGNRSIALRDLAPGGTSLWIRLRPRGEPRHE